MNNLIDLIELQPVPSTIVIILCATVTIWQILNKMTAQTNDNEHEAKVIRALVIARGKNGATLQQIKRENVFKNFLLFLKCNLN